MNQRRGKVGGLAAYGLQDGFGFGFSPDSIQNKMQTWKIWRIVGSKVLELATILQVLGLEYGIRHLTDSNQSVFRMHRSFGENHKR